MILAQLPAWITTASRAPELVTAADVILVIKVAMARTDEVFGTRKVVIAINGNGSADVEGRAHAPRPSRKSPSR
jgi:hypothetical protein